MRIIDWSSDVCSSDLAEEPVVSASLGAEPILVNATRFRLANEVDWARLDRIVGTIEKKPVRALDDDDLLALPVLYRGALSSLSVARETSLDRALVRYLEQLCTRAYFQIYGVQTSGWRQLRAFVAQGWPDAIAGLARETLAALVLTVFGTILGYLLVRHDAGWFYDIIPNGLAAGRDQIGRAHVCTPVTNAHTVCR